MAIGPIELTGAMTRLQDVSTQRHNENTKVFVDQNNFQAEVKREIDNRLNQVHQSDNAENNEAKYDAKEKGNGAYSGDGGKRRKKDDTAKDGKVLPKNAGNRFDMKI